ncbi:acyl carrier protein [Streptomyces sp. NPDC006530]|uniref:acyl carrier protein n=1 Tax=Streptomyces sp. NPDC006530 TaxID=3364750 RepID=UPI00369CD633
MSREPTEPAAITNGAARTVSRIWGELLGVADIRPDEDFFDLGGHSLIAVEIISRIEHAFGVGLSMRTFYENPTVSGVVRVLTSTPTDRD